MDDNALADAAYEARFRANMEELKTRGRVLLKDLAYVGLVFVVVAGAVLYFELV